MTMISTTSFLPHDVERRPIRNGSYFNDQKF